MNKFIFILTFIVSIVGYNTALAQDELKAEETKDTKRDTRTFYIKSLDGKNEKVKIIPGYFNRILKIGHLKDTINILGFWGVPAKICLLNKNFIEIKYKVRGGSNLGLGNTMILCIAGNKLYEALDVLRYTRWDSGDLETDYHLNLKLNGNVKSNYKLNIAIYDSVYSKPNPEKNYVYKNQTILNFDLRQHVFYSVKENIYDRFIKTGTNKKTKQKIDGNFPMIILGRENYYFINDRWYQLASSNQLNEFQ